MATYSITTKQKMNVLGDYVDSGLSVQISSMSSNPFDEIEKIHKAFMRVHGIDLKAEGYLNQGYLGFQRI